MVVRDHHEVEIDSEAAGGPLNELALFAGVGGSILASKLLGWYTVCAVEAEPYRREVLLRRQRDGLLPLFPIWDRVEIFDGRSWKGKIDILTADFPCRPWTWATQKSGTRNINLWSETKRIIAEVDPPLVFLQQVPRLLLGAYFGEILGGLHTLGYDAVWDCFSASSVGASHERDRLFILCRKRRALDPSKKQDIISSYSLKREFKGQILLGRGQEATPRDGTISHPLCWWSSQPRVDRVAHGCPDRVERLETLGDGQVPAVVVSAWRWLTKKLKTKKLKTWVTKNRSPYRTAARRPQRPLGIPNTC